MSERHTATPWHLVDNGMYFEIVVPWKSSPGNIDQYCPKICSVSYEDNEGIVGKPNAEFIVRACNAHDDLLEALRRCKFDSLNMSLEDLEFCRIAYAKATGEKE